MKLAELIIELSTNTASLKKSFDESLAMANSFASSLKSVLGAALPSLSVAGLAAGLKQVVEDTVKAGEEIHKLSNVTGLSAEALSGLKVVASESGESLESLGGVLARAGKNLEQAFIKPGSEAGKVLHALFTNAEVESLKLATPEQRIEALARKIFGLSDAEERDFAASAMFGRGWMANEETLRKLAMEGFAVAEAKADLFNMTLDPEGVAKLHAFDQMLKTTSLSIQGLTQSAGLFVASMWSDAFPGLLAMNEQLDKMEAHGGVLPTDFIKGMGDLKLSADALKAVPSIKVTGSKSFTDLMAEGNAKKPKTDVLAEIIEREKDEISSLGILDKAHRAIQESYQRTLREIEKQVKAGGSLKESYTAQGLALDIYNKKLLEYMESAIKIPKLPKWGEEFAAAGGATPIDFTKKMIPPMAAFDLGAPTAKDLQLTIDQVAALGQGLDRNRAYQHALSLETNLSAESFKKLAAAFHGWTEEAIAADPAGQRLIAYLTRLDKLGIDMSFGERFTSNLEEMKIAGDDFGAHLADTFTHAIDSFQNDLARFIVTGQGGFKQLFDSLAEDIIKSGLQKMTANLITASGVGKGGSPSSPVASSLPAFVIPFIGKAGGGDVSANDMYMVGEKGPELFSPGRSGTVLPNNILGGGTYIDARGADAGVEHRVSRAMSVAAIAQRTYGMVSNYDFSRRGGSIT